MIDINATHIIVEATDEVIVDEVIVDEVVADEVEEQVV